MIKRVLSLYVSVFLAVGPLAAQSQRAVVSGGGGPTGLNAPAAGPALDTILPALPRALPTQTATKSGWTPPVLTIIEGASAQPEKLRALAADPSLSASYARALITGPVTPAARAAAISSIGGDVVALIESAVQTLASRTAGSAKASAALKTVAAEFAALDSRDPESFPVAPAPAASQLAPASRAQRTLKSVAVAITMALSMAVAAPALHAQDALVFHNISPAAVTAQIASNQTQAEVVHAADINDAINKWTTETHLIIIGNPGLDAGSQRALAAFLADKHWTVIVAENASGMAFRDADGNTRYGKEALEYGAGQGLFRKHGFSSQADAASGLADGSILVISMGEHYLFLRNSEAQRINGLDGAAQFPGNLDQWAKARLRAGGDISGAVRETVTNIDAQLQSSVASSAQSAQASVADAKSAVEEASRARAAFERSHPSVSRTVGSINLSALRGQLAAAEKALSAKKASAAARIASETAEIARSATSDMRNYESNFVSGQAALAAARGEIDALEKASGSFLNEHSKATGDLARPDIHAMREQLKSAESTLAANPSAAKSAAESVASQVRDMQSALNEHAAGADKIAASEALLKQLESRERAGSASNDLVSAKQALREAREAHEMGASSWTAQLQSAKASLDNAERTISGADAAAHRNALLALWLKIIAGVMTLGTSLALNWFARKAGRKAEAELLKWDGILEKKLDAIIDELDKRMDVYVGPIAGEKSRGWEEETAAAAAQVRKDAGRAKLLLAMARSIHDRATALVRPTALTPGWFINQFFPSRFRKAESLLASEPLTFKPEDGFDALFEKKSDWRGDLYGEAKDYAPVNENFTSVMNQFNATSKSAVAALDAIETASTGYGAAFDATQAAISAAEKAAAAAAASAYFKLEALGLKILPQARETLAAARGKAEKNPVGAMKGQGALAERMTAEALSLSELALAMYKGEVSFTDPIISMLAAASVGTEWIAKSRSALDAQAAKLAASLYATSGAQGLMALKNAYATHTSNLTKAKNGLGAINATLKDAVAAAEAVTAARAQIGSALRLDSDNTLRETDNDPGRRLSAATDAVLEASKLLGDGKLAEAESSQKLGADLVNQANAIVTNSLKSLKEQAGDVAGRISEAQRLDALLPERAEILKTIIRDFAATTLGLAAGDVTHPNANGTVEDNIDEAKVAIDAAKTKRENAVRAFREAKVLESASLLDQAKAHELIAQGRLDEISGKRARLDKAVADNAAALEKLEAKSRAWKTEIPGDRRTMRPTMKAYDAAVNELGQARAAADAKKGDPFKAAAAIATVTAGLDQLWVKLNNDRDAYAEVVRSLKAAEAQLDTAARLASDAKGDGVADSAAITAAYRELADLGSAYKTTFAASQVEHGEWPALDREADRITSQAAHVAAVLTGELAAAARATESISRAAAKVQEATNWTGSYGVSVPGSPGSGSLSSARAALNNGDYDGAIRHADSARSAAIAAIQTAEAEVSRRRREEEEERQRQEEARRQRQREEDDRRRRSEEDSRRSRDSGSSGGGSSWGSTGSGGGSSSW